ncbi:eg:bacr7a4.20 protein [Holotrichia oblita]|uniref:Eg:bacr7a4.20 protein n=1 Tax=Holotrichia oblita TaxID=644536 RepID=A0ACB9TW90_HOLOL|nr:eg:bacr7a4.20 protein [Holotrichia oblita]
MYLILTSIIISYITWTYLKNKKKSTERILGIYSVEGQWFYLKYFTMLLMLKIRKFSSKRNKSGMGYGVGCTNDLEKIQPLSSDKKVITIEFREIFVSAFDAVFYHGVSKSGYYFVGGIERRHNNKVNGLVYLLVS